MVVDQSGVGPRDVLFLISNSGRNCAAIDAALEGKKEGAATVAITSLKHASQVSSATPTAASCTRCATMCSTTAARWGRFSSAGRSGAKDRSDLFGPGHHPRQSHHGQYGGKASGKRGWFLPFSPALTPTTATTPINPSWRNTNPGSGCSKSSNQVYQAIPSRRFGLSLPARSRRENIKTGGNLVHESEKVVPFSLPC